MLDRLSLSDATIVLFLDDLELITDQDVRDFLQRLLTNLGPHHRVIIGSRTASALALGRLRAHGLLLEFDQGDLRFTKEETASYLERQSFDAPAVLQSLQQRTEGWPAALQMAVITLNAKGKSGSDWLQRFSGSIWPRKSSTVAPKNNGIFCCARVCSANSVPRCAMQLSNELTVVA